MFFLDTNCFIEPSNKFYPFDMAPRYWEFLLEECAKGSVVVIDRVHAEVLKKEDMLNEWLKKEFSAPLGNSDRQDVLAAHREVINWVYSSERFKTAAKRDFASGEKADPWLIAHARAKNGVLVTLEQPDPECKRNVLIPEVCMALDVAWLSLFDWLRELKFRF